MSTPISGDIDTPFTAGAINGGPDFWKEYVDARPHPTDDFFDLIHAYHTVHGDPRSRVAHDVGTGPGNIAVKLLRHFDHVVGSDVNEKALAAAPALISVDKLKRMTLVVSPAEQLPSAVMPEHVGKGQTDLVVVSECIPLLDVPSALEAFSTMLRPGGTLAIYFYGRPIFTGDDADGLNEMYDRVATRLCQLQWPIKGTPGFTFHARSLEALSSSLDNVAIPSDAWESVERYKWNPDFSLMFSPDEGYDFAIDAVDRRASAEVAKDIIDRDFWVEEWDVGRVEAFVNTIFPGVRERAGRKYGEVESLLKELEMRMGGSKATKKVSFPVVLLLATKK